MNDTASQSSSSTDPASKPQRGKFNFWRWFWLGTIPVSLVWVYYSFYVPSNHVTWAKDFASAQQQAAQSGKPILMFFTGKWCVPCRIMKRTVWADAQVEAVVKAGFTPVMIDLDDPNAAETVRRYHVGATPTTIITDPQGNILERAEVGMSKTVFLGWLGKLKPGGSKVPIPLAK
jgi:protein disulfide-isomerase